MCREFKVVHGRLFYSFQDVVGFILTENLKNAVFIHLRHV